MKSLSDARATLKADNFSTDKAAIKIFIDKSNDVLEMMDSQLLTLKEDMSNGEALIEIRRGFHVLRSYGRNVGSNTVSEISWAIEFLLAEALNEKVMVSETLIAFIRETKQTLSTFIYNFSDHQVPSSDPAIIILKAANLRLKKDINHGFSEEITIHKTSLHHPPPVKIFARTDVMSNHLPLSSTTNFLNKMNDLDRNITENLDLSNNNPNINNLNPVTTSDKISTDLTDQTDEALQLAEKEKDSLSIFSTANKVAEASDTVEIDDIAKPAYVDKQVVNENANLFFTDSKNFVLDLRHLVILLIMTIILIIISALFL